MANSGQFPVAQGTVSYSGTYIPEVWSSKLLIKFYEGTVLTQVTNTDYEGEIKNQGDTVKIRTQPDIVIFDYEKGMNLPTQQPEPTVVELLINKGKGYNYSATDLDKKQADIAFINSWATDASNQMKIEQERDVFADVYSDVDASNTGASAGADSGSYNMGATGAPIAMTRENVLDYITDAGSVLSEQNVPEDQRYAIIPTWMANLLKKSDLKNADQMGDSTSVTRTGRIGMIDGVTIYRSNLIASVTDGAVKAYHALVGHISAITWATQLVHDESLRNPNDYGDLTRGLQVFGYKVIKPESLVDLYAYKA